MQNENRVRLGCYATNVSMAVVANLPPLLFITFRLSYGVSYSLLGLLVLVNFCTQLLVDLFFSFFSHKLNVPFIVKVTPVLTIIGFLIYALYPTLLPSSAYFGLVLGTIVFSAAAGLAEVLMSPTVAALPSDNPERDMSKLHSVYAWGAVFVVLFSTLFLWLFGAKKWYFLVLLFIGIPLIATALFSGAKIPVLQSEERTTGAMKLCKRKEFWLFVAAIFLGGAAECTMSQWSSGYLEKALGIKKVWGDIFGVTVFSMALGLGRTLYAKIGKNIEKVLLLGGIGATVCYLLCVFSPAPIVGLFACALTGFCVSMLWPGSLIASSSAIPNGGVFLYAMMAAGGDLGGSLGPQLVGSVTDTVVASDTARKLAVKWGIGAESLGLRVGFLVGTLFPILSIVVYANLLKRKNRRVKKEEESEVD